MTRMLRLLERVATARRAPPHCSPSYGAMAVTPCAAYNRRVWHVQKLHLQGGSTNLLWQEPVVCQGMVALESDMQYNDSAATMWLLMAALDCP